MTQAQILADVFQATRDLSNNYISRLEAADPLAQVEYNGKKLNSPLWIVAHLCWSQNMLQSKLLKGPNPNVAWLKDFAFGSDAIPTDQWPSYQEASSELNRINELCLGHVRSLDDSILDDEIYVENIDWRTSARGVITHSIRHEGMHTGHLSWLYKLLLK